MRRLGAIEGDKASAKGFEMERNAHMGFRDTDCTQAIEETTLGAATNLVRQHRTPPSHAGLICN